LAIDFDSPPAVSLIERAAFPRLDQLMIPGRIENVLSPIGNPRQKADRKPEILCSDIESLLNLILELLVRICEYVVDLIPICNRLHHQLLAGKSHEGFVRTSRQ